MGDHFKPEFQTQESVMFSLERKKWIQGPDLPKSFDFFFASAVALNRTVVLFVGIKFQSYGFYANYKSNLAFTYDFTTQIWKMQHILPFGNDEDFFVIHQITSSAILHQKNGSRYLINFQFNQPTLILNI